MRPAGRRENQTPASLGLQATLDTGRHVVGRAPGAGHGMADTVHVGEH